jgi:hypothetical protein
MEEENYRVCRTNEEPNVETRRRDRWKRTERKKGRRVLMERNR